MFLRILSKRLVALVLDLKISILVEGEFDNSNIMILCDFNVGPIFSEPVLCGGYIFIGTRDGYLYCLKAIGNILQHPVKELNGILRRKV